jgi:hypothetical protein
MNLPIYLRATFTEWLWESDEPDTDPTVTDGYCDPSNPWGGFDVEVPEGLCGPAFTAWQIENVDHAECATLSEAVHFVVDFPGGVWNYQESDPEQDYRTGAYREVTLHVPDENQEQVFKWAAIIERIQDARYRAQATR